ncbi:hypothetical protein W97_02254 [Coniosporium apollinis CBS 100218]|uniref:Uncharacterized protein n=1 Tax=Coniosporium apollinis (strain CBS 100218) TaxID=1168221 RepID=R7YMD5_CONA1|nr:uncharacterized protein W97_02254 [Coniosporium apollinis CBS 100218]EON63028.1 hypothetical protein W97_02254 [Coniosporium apollinis CBS 100218]
MTEEAMDDKTIIIITFVALLTVCFMALGSVIHQLSKEISRSRDDILSSLSSLRDAILLLNQDAITQLHNGSLIMANRLAELRNMEASLADIQRGTDGIRADVARLKRLADSLEPQLRRMRDVPAADFRSSASAGASADDGLDADVGSSADV